MNLTRNNLKFDKFQQNMYFQNFWNSTCNFLEIAELISDTKPGHYIKNKIGKSIRDELRAGKISVALCTLPSPFQGVFINKISDKSGKMELAMEPHVLGNAEKNRDSPFIHLGDPHLILFSSIFFNLLLT